MSLSSWWPDVRFSTRLLLKHRGFTLTAIGVLALGIGVNAGIFGLINGLLLRPLAGDAAPGELVGLYSHDRTTERGYRAFSYAGFTDVRDAGGPFLSLAAHNVVLAGVTENGTTRQAMSDVVSAGFFEALGVRPILGRDFSREEERPGAGRHAVIVSYPYWKRRGFDPDILQRTVRINGQDYAVIGVAPEGFGGTMAIIGTEFWLPLGVHDEIENDFDTREHRALADRETYTLVVIGRLKPGVTREQADAQLKVLSASLEQAYPAENKDQDLVVRPLSRLGVSTSPSSDGELWMPMALLQGLAAAVLLTACLNLANMMLAFGAARQKELAIRIAVGGQRGRIVRQLLVQGLLLSLAGGVVGLVAASWAMQALVSSISTALPITLSMDFTPDWRVVSATLAFCTLATVGFGLWPALRLSRPDVLTALKGQGGEVAGKLGGRFSVRGTLVTAQLALSLALLILSSLFVRGAAAGASADPGFALEPIVLAQVETRLGGFDEVRSRELRRESIERLRRLPGVEAVAAGSVVPFGDITVGTRVQREGRRLRNEDPEARGRLVNALKYTITSDYFRTLGTPMLRGREFTAAEEIGVSDTVPVIIDAALADSLFPNEDPLGQVLQYGADSSDEDRGAMTIVGVAPTLRHDLFEQRPEAHLYLPAGLDNGARFYAYVRAAGGQDASALVPAVGDTLRAVDPNLPVMSVRSFASHHAASATVWLLGAAARLFLGLGLAAAFVAIVGLYGVRSYLVSRRAREFGIRMAIGASPSDVQRLVLGEAAWSTLGGVGIGLAMGAGLGLAMSRLLYQVSPFDPVSFLGASALLATSSLAAAMVPARRAARVAPMEALRDS